MNNTQVYIIPGWYDEKNNERLMVRIPSNINTIVPDKGMYVSIIGSIGRYWRKKIKTGEVIKIDPPQTEAKLQRKKEGK